MQVIGSPFKVMKILSEGFGYSVPVCPIEGDLSLLLGIYVLKIVQVRSRVGSEKRELAFSQFRIEIKINISLKGLFLSLGSHENFGNRFWLQSSYNADDR